MNANNTTKETKQIHPGDLELTYADFDVAKTMLEASEHFFHAIRQWVNFAGHPDAQMVIDELDKGGTMIAESKFRMETGMKKLNGFVEQAYGEKEVGK